MPFVQDLLARFRQTVTAYAGDEALMQASVSSAANVIVADGEVAGEEFETALIGVIASPILGTGYDVLMLKEALHEAISRAYPGRTGGEPTPGLSDRRPACRAARKHLPSGRGGST